jgi:hypothetical protein
MEPGGFLMQVQGDTETRGYKILGFQIPNIDEHVFNNLLLLGNKNFKGAVIEAISSFIPWSIVCCYLTGHKQ